MAHFEVEGRRNFVSGYVSQNSRFYHEMSVFVLLSVSVYRAMECEMTC